MATIIPVHNYIKKWLDIIGTTKPDRPVYLSEEDKKLNIALIREEVEELLDAMENNNDIKEICDGGGDTLWVVTQGLMLYGVNINDVIRAIGNSNLSKFCETEEEAIRTVEAYAAGTHPAKLGESIDTYYIQVEDVYVIKRKSDNKILKALSFQAPDFTFIEERLTQ